MPAEEILVLASSKKLGGRCLAGITREGGWIRPVSGGDRGLWKAECEVDRRWPEPLDVVRFGYAEHLDDPAQPENVLIDGSAWELKGRVAPEEAYERIARFTATGPALLGNHGKAVPEDKAAEGMDASLALVEPDSGVSFIMRPPEEELGKYKPRAVFRFCSTTYDLVLTDIPLVKAVREAGVGEHAPEDLGIDCRHPLVTVSLGEANNGWHTKLVAAVLLLP